MVAFLLASVFLLLLLLLHAFNVPATTAWWRGSHHVCALVVVDAASPSSRQERVLLTSVQSLVFSENVMTESNIGKPVAQLSCVGGDCMLSSQRGGGGGMISNALCQNMGINDRGLPSWRCTASMPKGCKFQTTVVSCEGYSSEDDDPYILAGSCALLYSTVCDERSEKAQQDELELRRRIQQQREKQNELQLQEVERIRGQAARDECELRMAAALYPVMQQVEVKQDSTTAFDREPISWRRGYVGAIDCDGRYRIDFSSSSLSSEMESMYPVLESELRVAVDPIYVEEHVSTPAESVYRRSTSFQKTEPHTQQQMQTQTQSKTLFWACAILVCCCFLVVLYAMYRFSPILTETAVIECLYVSRRHELSLHELRGKLEDEIARENSRQGGQGDAKLQQILERVAVAVETASVMKFRLKPDLIARERQREQDRLEQMRREQQRRKLQLQRQVESFVITTLYDSPGHRLKLADIHEKLRNSIGQGHDLLQQILATVAIEDGYKDSFGFPPPYAPRPDDLYFRLRPDLIAMEQQREKDKIERERREREKREQEILILEMLGGARHRPKRTPHEEIMYQGSRESTPRLDTEAMARVRELQTRMLKAQSELRIAQVKAKQDRAEASRIREYQIQIEQLQRAIENDTCQLHDATQRFDALMEEYEAIGMASTKIR